MYAATNQNFLELLKDGAVRIEGSQKQCTDVYEFTKQVFAVAMYSTNILYSIFIALADVLVNDAIDVGERVSVCSFFGRPKKDTSYRVKGNFKIQDC